MDFSRRRFLAALGASSATCAAPAAALETLKRTGGAHFTGIGLAAYSFRPQMEWFRGEHRPGGMNLFAFLDYCASQQLEAAELTAYFFPEPFDAALLPKIKRHAAVLGLDLASGAIGNNFALPPDSDAARQEVAKTRDWIDRYADLGVSAIRVFAGQPPKGTPLETGLDHIQANLEQALVHAEKRGMILGLENHDFMTKVDHLLEILSRFDSPFLGVTFDTANIAPTPDPYAELAKIAPFTVTAQIKASIPVDGVKQPVDHARVVRLLRDAGYRGYLIVEYEEAADPEVAIPREIEALRGAVAEA